MGWLRRLVARFRTGRDPCSADQILDFLIGTRIVPADRIPQELVQEGWDARRREQPEIAHERFIAAAQLARQSGDNRTLGRALIALADNALHFYPVDADVFSVRETLARYAKQILSSIQDDEGVAKALRVQATMAPGVAGREMLEESLRISQKIGDVEGLLSSFDRLGCHLALCGDKTEAMGFKRKALEMARDLGDQERIAECLFSLAIGFEGCPDEHRAVLEEAQLIFQKLGRNGAQARCLMLCAQLACDESDYERRIGYLERAERVAREDGDLSLCATCLEILVDLFRDQGDMSKAETLEQERKLLPADEFPKEMAKELEQAFATGDAEKCVSAVRKWFSGGTWVART